MAVAAAPNDSGGYLLAGYVPPASGSDVTGLQHGQALSSTGGGMQLVATSAPYSGVLGHPHHQSSHQLHQLLHVHGQQQQRTVVDDEMKYMHDIYHAQRLHQHQHHHQQQQQQQHWLPSLSPYTAAAAAAWSKQLS